MNRAEKYVFLAVIFTFVLLILQGLTLQERPYLFPLFVVELFFVFASSLILLMGVSE